MATRSTTRLGTAPKEGIKGPVAIDTLTNITLSGLQTIRNYAVQAGDRVLVRNQTDPTENGIYDADVGTWKRATDWNNANDVVSGVLIVSSGSNTLYRADFDGVWSAGSTSVTFTSSINDWDNSVITTNSETVTLTDGQVIVNFVDTTTTQSAIYLFGDDVDNGQLLLNTDYTVDSETQITLSESYPAGSVIKVVQNVGTQDPVSNIETFDNVAQMKAASLTVGQIALCKRYYAGGSLVAGLVFNIVAGGTGTDDGGSFHNLSNGNQAQLITGKGRTNPLHFGAGTGTDDTTAFTNAIAYANSLYIPEGVYYLEDVALKSSFSIVLESPKTELRGVTTSSNVFTSNAFLTQFYLKGGRFNFCKAGILHTGNSAFASSTIEGCLFTNLEAGVDATSAVGLCLRDNKFGVDGATDNIQYGVRLRKSSQGQTNINNFYNNRYANYSVAGVEYETGSFVARANNHYGDWFEDSSVSGLKVGGNTEGLNFYGGYFETTGDASNPDIDINATSGLAVGIHFHGVNFLTGNATQTERIKLTGNSTVQCVDCPVTLLTGQVFVSIESSSGAFHSELYDNRLNAVGAGTYESRLFSKTSTQKVSWSTGVGSGFVTNDDAPLRFDEGVKAGNWTTFTSADASPSVRNGNRFKTAGTTAITDFDEGTDGQEITVKAGNTITVLGVSMVLNDVARFINDDGTWLHVNS